MRRLAALALTLAFAAPLRAQTHTDFSGKWVLDPKTASGMMAPTAATYTVTQDAKTLKADQSVTMQMGDRQSTFTYNLDGSPSKNSVDAGGMALDLNSAASWDGPTLVIKTTATIQDQTMQQNERWTLAADGKSLSMQRDFSFGGQTGNTTMTFNKQ